MAWDLANTVIDIPIESPAGNGTFMVGWVIHQPGETAHIHIERTDSTPTGDWVLELYGSPDAGTKISTVPLLSYRLQVVDLTKDLIIADLYSWRVKLIGLGSAVSGTINYRLDNVDLK